MDRRIKPARDPLDTLTLLNWLPTPACPTMRASWADRREATLGGHPQALERYALAVVSHIGLVAAWYLFVKLGEVPKFVMPSPYDTVHALVVPNYRWPENIAVTTIEIFGGYILAVVFGIAAALLFSWFRWLEMAVMPLLVSLNMIPKVALGPLIIVWFSYGIGPNVMIAFAICFFPIVLTTARGLNEVEPDLLDLVRTLRGSRWQIFTKIQLPGALPYIFSGMKVAAVLAVSEATFDVEEGELVSLVGPSGCGKTTLLKILAGLHPSDGGTVRIGTAAQPFDPSRDIGMVFQQPLLLKWRRVLDNVLLPAEILGLSMNASRSRARDLLALVGLRGSEDSYPYELSGGMQQRAAIARALIHDPKLILMDEPFGALDALTREKMNLELLHIWSKAKKTIVFVTHGITEAVFLGTRVIVLSAGH